MTRYYARVCFNYSETVNRLNHVVFLDNETHSNLYSNSQGIGIYPLLLHYVDDEDKCRHIIDKAVVRVFRKLYDTGVLKGDYQEFFPDDPDDYEYVTEKICGNYRIKFPMAYPMPDKLFYEIQKWACLDENINTKPYMRHLYNVEVTCEVEGQRDESEMRDAVSNFEQWKDKVTDSSILYPSHRDQLTISGLCDCLLYELIGEWKSWAFEYWASERIKNGLPIEFTNESPAPLLLESVPETKAIEPAISIAPTDDFTKSVEMSHETNPAAVKANSSTATEINIDESETTSCKKWLYERCQNPDKSYPEIAREYKSEFQDDISSSTVARLAKEYQNKYFPDDPLPERKPGRKNGC